MRITPEIVRSEFIGIQAGVARSRHHECVGVSGKIVDETKNTFTLLQGGKARMIAKDSALFRFKFPDGEVVELDGKLLMGRPEDRLKKTVRRLW